MATKETKLWLMISRLLHLPHHKKADLLAKTGFL
jgi:hypothetical protein